MAELGQVVHKVRSKNAGPFWLTIDIFCGDAAAFAKVTQSLSTSRVADALNTDVQSVKRFEISDLNVLKFSLPRPVVQGAVVDRDMHGAGWAALISELDIG